MLKIRTRKNSKQKTTNPNNCFRMILRTLSYKISAKFTAIITT